MAFVILTIYQFALLLLPGKKSQQIYFIAYFCRLTVCTVRPLPKYHLFAVE